MKPRVFIASSAQAVRVAEFAQRDLMYCSEPEVWSNDKFPSRQTPIESLFKILEQFQFALFVAVPEDVTTKGGTEYHTVRDNVLFEMGLFLGRLGRDRVFCIAPNDVDGARLHLPSDLTGIQPNHYDAKAQNLQAAVSPALLELKEAIRQFDQNNMIFDARKGLTADHLVNKGGKRHDSRGNAISVEAQADVKLTNEALEITRKNMEGVWEVEVRPTGRSSPTVARLAGADRMFEVGFEARVTGTQHVVRCVSIDASNWDWIDNRPFTVDKETWQPFTATLRAPMNLDILFRIQDEIEQPPDGTLYLRNITARATRT